MRVVLILSLILTSILAKANELASNYIHRYKAIAIEEMRTYGVPASIKLAQGMLESNWGRSDLATTANNHFGIKCGGSWSGDTFYKHDDDRDRRGRLKKSCFRAFDRVEDSYRAHTQFLRNPKKSSRYGWLFDLDVTDYKAWAHGLKKSGYASDPNYPKKLISLIEKYKLYLYDSPEMNPGMDETPRYVVDTELPPTETKESREEVSPVDIVDAGKYIKVNNCKAYVSPISGTISEVAEHMGTDVVSLLDINDAYLLPEDRVEAGDLVYVQKKKRSFLGADEFHKVEEGESLISIAQMYGIRIKSLRAKNMFPKGAEVVVGEKLSLKRNVNRKNRPRFHKEGMTRSHAFLTIKD